MRDIDFLPDWYPKIKQRYRWLIAQAGVSTVVVVLMAGYAFAKRVQVHNAMVSTAQCEAQISQSQQQLVQLTQKMKFEDELREEDQIVARIGLGVDPTRLIKSLEEAMTPQMGLTNISLETVEQPRLNLTALLPGHRSLTDGTNGQDIDRKLKVVVDGVSPTDTDSATFYGNLLTVGCFDDVNIEYMHPGVSRDGHITREFEVTFDLNLNPPAEAKP